MEQTRFSRLNLDIGECIYCGSVEPPLTREHVLPRGLGGVSTPEGHGDALVLQEATCERCRRITQKIEEECLRPMMDPGRARLGLKRKDRNKGKMDALLDLPDGSSERRDIDSNEILGAIALPAYYEAGALTNRPLTDTAPCDYRFFIVAPASQRLLQQAARVGVSLTINSKTFAQMLAKIALGAAVAQFGVRGFEPLVQDFILKNANEYGHWVGGFAGVQEWKETKSEDLHRINLRIVQAKAGIFIIAEIRLFAEFGGPTNYVVVGRPIQR